MTASTLTVSAISAVRSATTDARVISDCDRALYWLTSGAAAMGIRCRAASRVAAMVAA